MQQLQQQVMSDIVRRIKINSEITRSADWQIHRLKQLGMADNEIKEAIKKSLKMSNSEIDKMYKDVIKSGYAHNKEIYKKAGIKQLRLACDINDGVV